MQLYQPQNGYCYNSDTYFLAEFISINLQKFKNISGEVLDIGSGSGILGLLVKNQYQNLNLNACEIQEAFVFLSMKNAYINKIEMNMYEGSYFDIEFKKKFDIIISNPPFYPSCVVKTKNENINIARYNDNMPLGKFISNTAKNLKAKGKFFFCYDVKLLNDIIINLKSNKLNIESIQFMHPKASKKASLVMIYARANSNSMMDILPPLIMFEKENFSKEVTEIYEKYSAYSIKVEL